MKKMYEVFYNGEKIGLVIATNNTAETESQKLFVLINRKQGQHFDHSLLSWSDQNSDKYRHMLN